MESPVLAQWRANELEEMGTAARAALHDRMPRARVQYLVLPSFSGCKSWEVAEHWSRRSDRTLYTGRYRQWLRQHDQEKLESPVVSARWPARLGLAPTIETVEFELETENLGPAMARLGEVRLPLCPEPLVGLDGTGYELVLDAGFVGSRFRWWEQPPAGWEPLARFADEFVEICRAAFAKSVQAADDGGAAANRSRQR